MNENMEEYIVLNSIEFNDIAKKFNEWKYEYHIEVMSHALDKLPGARGGIPLHCLVVKLTLKKEE